MSRFINAELVSDSDDNADDNSDDSDDDSDKKKVMATAKYIFLLV